MFQIMESWSVTMSDMFLKTENKTMTMFEHDLQNVKIRLQTACNKYLNPYNKNCTWEVNKSFIYKNF